MKTKSFLFFSVSVFATSLFLIVFHSQQPQSIQNIVTQTHQHIKDFQENLRDVEENHLVQEERYLQALGLVGEPPARWHNTTVPVLVTYARGDGHEQAVSFVRAAAKLPYTLLLYNIGLKPYSITVVSNYCNSSKCAIINFDLSEFPSHISDESLHAVRPLIVQHALSRVGGVIFADTSQRWTGSVSELTNLWTKTTESKGGLLVWPRLAAVTSLTHPRMFHYFHADTEDFLFVQMVDVTRFLVVDRPGIADLMRPWIQCALTLDCIMPIGAQSGGCKFDKKPQYRYSGCHEQDASALSIVLAQRSGFEESHYAARGWPPWRKAPDEEAAAELRALERNNTDNEYRTEHSAESLTSHPGAGHEKR